MDETCDIRRVRIDEEIDKVVDLARVIWTDHYSPIIGADQVDYMLGGLHSRSAIASEVASGALEYYLISRSGRDLGYLAIKPEDESLFLSKIYILSSERGRGVGKQALAFVRDRARSLGLNAIRLTVNKMNTGSITAYERVGFRRTGSVKADIGGGYFMDDYTMEWAC